MATAALTGSSHLGVTDNQKRWLVAGIALNKILIPQIRPFVQQGINTEYNKLKTSHNIHGQSSSGRLQRWPARRLLKYENINGNDVHPRLPNGRLNYSFFDCRVTSDVDFARLYVENYMAKFTAFDDHCDASAVLSLLGGVPVFSAAIQSAAGDVKNARNDWAHCVFSKWEPAKFHQSFIEMDQLARNMTLPHSDERKLLGELNDWETRGTQLCMNSPVDPALLQLFQQEVKSLQDSVDNMSLEFEAEKVKINHELGNVTISLEEMNQRLHGLETGQQTLEYRADLADGRMDEFEEMLTTWKREEGDTKDKLGEMEDILKRLETVEGSSKDMLKETHEMSRHVKDKFSEMEEMLTTWKREEGDTEDKLGELEDILKRVETDADNNLEMSEHLRDKVTEMEDILKRLQTNEGSGKGTLKETHETMMDKLCEMEEMLKQWKSQGDSSSTKLGETEDAYGPAADLIDVIRHLYKSREGWLTPFPWCEEFQFHLDSIFTRLKMVTRKKERGVKTNSIVNMLEIFKPHEECSQPRKVLIEGQPGMGKTTYCNKVAFDWAKNRKAEDSFPDVQVLLLLRCREINSDLWEAIDDQILPRDIKKEEREKFFTFIQDNESKVLLVLDGLDELPTHKLPVYKEIIQGRMLSKCYLVVTARQEAGLKVRECCDTLLEVEGFTEDDAEGFTRRYFKTEEHLAEKLLDKLRRDASLRGLTAYPLNTALLCLLCEDFKGDLPKGRTPLYLKIVECVLRRYRKKKGLPETDEDLTQLYHPELKHLGCIALNGLRNDDMYFGDNAFRNCTSKLIPELGFLSVQPGRSKLRPSKCYGFLHKSFQEFLAAFYLSCQLVDEEISPDGLVADTRYFKEFEQVLMFACGILAQWCDAIAMALMASVASQINLLSDKKESGDYLCIALNCIDECEKDQGNLGIKVAHTLGSLLQIQSVFFCRPIGESGAAILAHTLEKISKLTHLDLYRNGIGDVGADALAKVITKGNSTLTKLDLSDNKISDSGAAALAEAVQKNSTLRELKLSCNAIGDSGAAALAEAVKTNSALTKLDLYRNEIGDFGAAALANAMKVGSMLIQLDLARNKISDRAAAELAEAMKVNATLTQLDLHENTGIGDLGATALAQAMERNSTLTQLDLRGNGIGDSGATALAKAIERNSKLMKLGLSDNKIGDLGADALANALERNSTLTELDLSGNTIGDLGAVAMAKAIRRNSTLTQLDLARNAIGISGYRALAKAIKANSVLAKLVWS